MEMNWTNYHIIYHGIKDIIFYIISPVIRRKTVLFYEQYFDLCQLNTMVTISNFIFFSIYIFVKIFFCYLCSICDTCVLYPIFMKNVVCIAILMFSQLAHNIVTPIPCKVYYYIQKGVHFFCIFDGRYKKKYIMGNIAWIVA